MPAAQAEGQARAQADAQRSPQPAAQSVAAATAETQRGAASAGGGRRDADVEIVTALMSHIEGRTPPAAARTNGAPRAAERTAARAMPDNIADLVDSCRSVTGTTEALACRGRICKGYWGKAEACPKRDRKAAERAVRRLQARSAAA